MVRCAVLWLKVVTLGCLLGLAFAAMIRMKGPAPRAQVAPLLQQVQALGNLHVVRLTYRDIGDFESSRQAAPWFASLPGGAELVQATTRNRATLSYVATVEAGIDLTKASVNTDASGTLLELPEPVVYEPNVTARVHDLKRGMFWRDENITTSAIEATRARMIETAKRQGILSMAQQNVRDRIGQLARDLGADVRVVFAGS